MYRVGIDLGGTNIKVGLIDLNYHIVDISSCKTNANMGADVVIDRIVSQVRTILKDNNVSVDEVEGVGLGCPGIVNSEQGTVIYSNNLNWNNVPIKHILNQRLKMPITVENDANCAVLGELVAGSGIGCKNIVLLTLGTGVGSGIVVNGELLTGSGYGGIAGHSTVMLHGKSCSCGRKGCLEAYASATALISETKKQWELHPDSILADLCEGKIDNIDGQTAFEAAKRGDPYGAQIVKEYIEALSNGIATLVNLFRPDKVLISGGVCNQGEALLLPINQKVRKYCFASTYITTPPVEVGLLKNTAGIIGAVSLINL